MVTWITSDLEFDFDKMAKIGLKNGDISVNIPKNVVVIFTITVYIPIGHKNGLS